MASKAQASGDRVYMLKGGQRGPQPTTPYRNPQGEFHKAKQNTMHSGG